MAIGRVVSVHFYSYAPWRGVWIENDCYCFLFMERKATPHGGAYGLKIPQQLKAMKILYATPHGGAYGLKSKVSSRSLYSVLLRPMEGRMD